MAKKRLDALLQEQMPEHSRRQIQSWIMQGLVLVEDRPFTKPGMLVKEDAHIVCKGQVPKFVSRAGYKLEKALEHFNINVTGLVVLDAGISTGGFTDCLLQQGVKKIYGIDVGYGQIHEKVRTNNRVVISERTNLREVRDVGELIDLVTLDLSFISILKVMDAVCAVLKPNGKLVTLIKPQFEAERHQIGKGGIIKDSEVHKEVIAKVTQGIIERGFELIDVTDSPIQGATGNKEFLAYFKRVI